MQEKRQIREWGYIHSKAKVDDATKQKKKVTQHMIVDNGDDNMNQIPI